MQSGIGRRDSCSGFSQAIIQELLRSSAVGLGVCLFICTFAVGQDQGINPDQLAFFEKRIRPVLVEHCYPCHSSSAKIIQGGLRLDHRAGLAKGGDSGPAIVPGTPDESLILHALRYASLEMPPKGKLSEAIIADFATWIAMGAPDPRLANEPSTKSSVDRDEGKSIWAFQPVTDPSPPVVKDPAWPQDPIDYFVLAKLEKAELRPVADADRYTWLRRVSLDLTGLPPKPEEIDAFIRDNSPHACASVVDRLLDSRAYGERWARHWLDLTGYADMIGTSNNVFAEHAWRYRDYLIESFNKDKPIDRFICEQIAGDLLPASSAPERAENITATGFLMVGDVEIVEPDKAKMEADHIDTQVSKIGTVFMGMTYGCARCHDHKFDPIGLEDYYAIAGMLRSSPSTHKIPFGVWSMLNSTELPELPEQLAVRRELEAEHAAKITLLKAEQAKLHDEKKVLEDQLAKSTKDIACDRLSPASGELAKRRDELTDRLKKLAAEIQHAEFFLSKAPKAFAMRDGANPADMPIYIRGNPYAPGKIVPRGALRVASWKEFPEIPREQSGRLQLADWLVDVQNPLTARVMVNRIWQKLFGEGLVRTVDYFGARGEKSTHPELLDYLAKRLIRSGWSQKKLIRALVLSRTYRLASTNDENALRIDPDNRLLWRMHRRRLDAEAIRDSVLAVSGELRESRGGPALVLEMIENTGGLVQAGVNPPNYTHRKPRLSQEFERTIYLPVMRTGFTGEDRLRSYFDFVNPAQITGQRNQTAAPTQSLFLMNSELFRKRAKSLAEYLLARFDTRDQRLDQLWLRVLGRPITPGERQEATSFLDNTQSLLTDDMLNKTDERHTSAESAMWQELCHSLLSSNYFVYRL